MNKKINPKESDKLVNKLLMFMKNKAEIHGCTIKQIGSFVIKLQI